MPPRRFEGAVLRRERRAADITGAVLADRIGVSRPSVTIWETGTGFPSLDKLPAIARALGRPLDELFPRDGTPDLLDLRCDAGLTQKDAGAAIGTTHNPVHNAEKGRRRLDPAYLPALAVAYGVSQEELEAAQDRSFGVAAPAHPAPPVLETLAEKITHLLETTWPQGAPTDADLARQINKSAGRPLIDGSQFHGLRTGRLELAAVAGSAADEAALYEALAEVMGVSPLFFQPDDAVARQVVAGIRVLAAGRKGVALAARGAEELGVSPGMLAALTEMIAKAERDAP
ncbi:helix-turn-helix domain-containing protein [Streptomyces sp. CA-111067]|uniref:helix-turn-helix domain-containing protein n=1 Tax=Streptomyces sp. CA-111067 TaxID=3240046 RepID=UPI003D983EC8